MASSILCTWFHIKSMINIKRSTWQYNEPISIALQKKGLTNYKKIIDHHVPNILGIKICNHVKVAKVEPCRATPQISFLYFFWGEALSIQAWTNNL